MKSNLLILGLALLGGVSCLQEVSNEEMPSGEGTAKPISLLAHSAGANGSRTFVEDGGTKVLWQPGDVISVYTYPNMIPAKFVAQNTEPSATAVFKCEDYTSDFINLFEAGCPIWALSPYSKELSSDPDRFYVPIKQHQKGIAGTYDPEAHVTIAYSEGRELYFRNVTGGVRFTLTQEGIDKITIKGWNIYSTPNSLSIDLDGDDISFPNNGNRNEITLTPEDGGVFKTGEWYYVTLAPVTTDYEIVFTFFKGDLSAELHIDKTIEIKSGVFGSIPEIDKNAPFLRPMKDVLMDFYYAMDGPNWVKQKNWGSDKDINDWAGIMRVRGGYMIDFYGFGLKGDIPDVIGELGNRVVSLYFSNEPGITGPIPEALTKLTRLDNLSFYNTSISSVPDLFSGMKSLINVSIYYNPEVTGPLPESLGALPNINRLLLSNNNFSGSLPPSWAKVGRNLDLRWNRLSGTIPQSYLDSEDSRELLYGVLYQQSGYGFDISGIDIPAYANSWNENPIEDLDGNVFSIADVVSNSKYTVYLFWAPWCPFSKVLIPQLRDYYEQYRQDGLEVIATVQAGEPDSSGAAGLWDDKDGQKQEIARTGCGNWYNFYWPDYFRFFFTSTPNAEVYDSNGDILFSSVSKFKDPVRNRFNKKASTDLIPFLESLLGPAGEVDNYASKDYSKDGKVITLQKATVGKGINLVFMGDAYTDKDMASGGLYESTMKKAMEEFFAVEPYKTFRNRFNVYAVKVVSRNGRIGEGYTTALGTYFSAGTTVHGNDDKCFEYAMKVPGIKSRQNLLVSVIINTRKHAGTAYLYQNDQCSVTYSPSYGDDTENMMGATLRHESGGHGFAFLADEYYQYKESAPESVANDYRESYSTCGWFSNVDFTDDPEAIRWSSFLSDSRYEGQIGIYEGGALYAYGAYRPTYDSIMNEGWKYAAFNAPSRQAIYKRIMQLSGSSYSFDAFLKYDAVNCDTYGMNGLRAPAPSRSEPLPHTAPPVIIK